MKSFKVIKGKNNGTRLPVLSSVVTALVLDRLHAVQWVWILVGCIYLLLWISCIVRLTLQEEIDLFPEETPKPKSWDERIEEIKNRKS